MRISQRNVIITSLILVSLWFLYSVRQILTPFILAAIFAYLLSPLVSILNKRLKVPKNLAVVFVYLGVIILLSTVLSELSLKLAQESKELAASSFYFRDLLFNTLSGIPYWLRDAIGETITSINLADLFSPSRLWPYFSGAFTGILSLFIFLISGFYFLLESDKLPEKITSFFPHIDKVEVAILFRKINAVLNDYLRGYLFLIIIMATAYWFGLTFLGVKYALMIGLLSGLAEIIPIIGPISAGTVAVLIAIFDGTSSLGLTPFFEGLTIVSMYFVYNQLENIFIVPFVLGHATKLHPLMVLFAVLAGGHLWGIMGMILAVPAAAIIRITLEFLFAQIA